MDAFAIDLNKLAPLGPATDTLGKLRPNIAESLGLSLETLIMIGCGDEHAACLGAGVTGAGIVGDIAGDGGARLRGQPRSSFRSHPPGGNPLPRGP